MTATAQRCANCCAPSGDVLCADCLSRKGTRPLKFTRRCLGEQVRLAGHTLDRMYAEQDAQVRAMQEAKGLSALSCAKCGRPVKAKLHPHLRWCGECLDSIREEK